MLLIRRTSLRACRHHSRRSARSTGCERARSGPARLACWVRNDAACPRAAICGKTGLIQLGTLVAGNALSSCACSSLRLSIWSPMLEYRRNNWASSSSGLGLLRLLRAHLLPLLRSGLDLWQHAHHPVNIFLRRYSTHQVRSRTGTRLYSGVAHALTVEHT